MTRCMRRIFLPSSRQIYTTITHPLLYLSWRVKKFLLLLHFNLVKESGEMIAIRVRRTLTCGGAGGPATAGGGDAIAPVGRPPEEHDALGLVAVREPDHAPHHSVPGPRPDRDGQRQAAAGVEQVLHAAPRRVHGLLLRRHEQPHRRRAARPDVVRSAVSLQQRSTRAHGS